MFMLFAFMVQSLIPAGFMPQQNADGTTTIVICTQNGPQEVVVEAEHNPFFEGTQDNNHDADGGNNTLCAYAPVLAQAGPVNPVFLTAPAFEKASALIPRATTLHARLLPVFYLAQGPPLLSYA